MSVRNLVARLPRYVHTFTGRISERDGKGIRARGEGGRNNVYKDFPLNFQRAFPIVNVKS